MEESFMEADAEPTLDMLRKEAKYAEKVCAADVRRILSVSVGSHIIGGTSDGLLMVWDAKATREYRNSFRVGHSKPLSDLVSIGQSNRLAVCMEESVGIVEVPEMGERMEKAIELEILGEFEAGLTLVLGEKHSRGRRGRGDVEVVSKKEDAGITSVNKLAWDEEGGVLLGACDDGRAVAWDVETGKLVASLGGHRGRVTCVAPLGHRMIATAGADGTGRIFDLSSGKCLTVLRPEADSLAAVAGDRGNRGIALGGAGGAVTRFDRRTFGPMGQTVIPKAHRRDHPVVTVLSFDPHAGLVAGLQDGRVAFLDTIDAAVSKSAIHTKLPQKRPKSSPPLTSIPLRSKAPEAPASIRAITSHNHSLVAAAESAGIAFFDLDNSAPNTVLHPNIPIDW